MADYTVPREIVLPALGKNVTVHLVDGDKEDSFLFMLGDYIVGELYIKNYHWCVGVFLYMKWPIKCIKRRMYIHFEDALLHALWHITTFAKIIQAGHRSGYTLWNPIKNKDKSVKYAEQLSIGSGYKAPLAKVLIYKNGSMAGHLLLMPDIVHTVSIESNTDMEDPHQYLREKMYVIATNMLVNMGILD